ncbi:MAG: fumarate hydratase [Candidatus Omnitrophota bacterium]
MNSEKLRIIEAREIEQAITELAVKANTVLRADILKKLKQAAGKEKEPLAKMALQQIIENAAIAKSEHLAICQDTGLPVIFVEWGEGMLLKNGSLEVAVNKGIETAYRKASFRSSIIQDPLRRKKDIRYTPAVIYVDMKPSDKVKLTVAPKGFGSENVSQVKMFKPTAEPEEIVDFVVNAAAEAGPNACPPFIIGVGIGATLDKAVILSKKALCRDITRVNPDSYLSALEKKMSAKINNLKIGPMGFGGKCTTLAVNILTAPTHIAGLPVAVSIGCHATRSATAIL